MSADYTTVKVIPMEPDKFLAVWSDSPTRAAAFFGYTLGVNARVEVQDRSDDKGRVLYHVFPTEAP